MRNGSSVIPGDWSIGRVRAALLAGCAIALFVGGAVMLPGVGGRWVSAQTPARAGAVSVDRLRTEDAETPMGVDRADPELSWRVGATVRGVVQTAYEVRVASSPARLDSGKADIWSSGRVESDQPWTHFKGAALRSAGRYYWRVRVWDGEGRASAWSTPATFEMGLLGQSDWAGAKWIAVAGASGPNAAYAGHYLRKAFTVSRAVRSARLYYSATGWLRYCADYSQPQACHTVAGIVMPSLNGGAVNDHMLDPAPADVKRALYTSVDATKLVRFGANVLGLRIAGDTDVIAKLVIKTTDGKTQTVATDGSWTSHASPVVHADKFAGINYDARREVADWDKPGVAAQADWKPVRESAQRVGAITLSSASELPPMRITKKWAPSSITETSPGVYTLDFGQNVTGRVHFRASGKADQKVQIIHAEKLTNKKEADPKSTGFNGLQTDSYTFAGSRADWSAEFAYYGFRYATISGLAAKPEASDIWAEQVNSDIARSGDFDSSDALINKIHHASLQTTLNNAHGIPEDCPHREKRGWSADAYVSDPQAFANFDMEGFYEKYLQDVRDSQHASGAFTDIAPAEPNYAKGDPDSVWGLVGVELPWDLYQRTGDLDVLRRSYDSMKRYIDWSGTIATDHVITKGKYRGDWVAYKSSHDPLLRTAFWYLGTRHLIDSARLLGRQDDVQKYEALANAIRTSFNRRFFDRATATYGEPGRQARTTTQAAQALPIAVGLVPDDMRDAAGRQLVRYITEVSKSHPESGLSVTRYVLEALQMIGRPDVIHAMASQRDVPSWVYMIENGPGTLWENWTPGIGSRQHTWSGVIDAHFFRSYGGINATSPGGKTVLIKPYVPATMTFARASETTPYGVVASEWRKANGVLRLDVVVPVGVTARVVVPGDRAAALVIDGKRAADPAAVRGVKKVEKGAGRTVFEIGSGAYRFES